MTVTSWRIDGADIVLTYPTGEVRIPTAGAVIDETSTGWEIVSRAAGDAGDTSHVITYVVDRDAVHDRLRDLRTLYGWDI